MPLCSQSSTSSNLEKIIEEQRCHTSAVLFLSCAAASTVPVVVICYFPFQVQYFLCLLSAEQQSVPGQRPEWFSQRRPQAAVTGKGYSRIGHLPIFTVPTTTVARLPGIWPFIYWLFSVVLAVPARGQEINEAHFTRYTTQQGLSHNMITGIGQDSIGYLWIATSSGLNRYDGNQFTHYYGGKDSTALPADAVIGLTRLDRQRMAFFARGVHIVNTCTGERTNVFVPYENRQFQYKFNSVTQVLSDSSGALYVLTRSGFYHFDNRHQLVFRHDYYKADKLHVFQGSFARSVFRLSNRHLAIIAFRGLLQYDIIERKFTSLQASQFPLLAQFLAYPQIPYQLFQPRPGVIIGFRTGTDSVIYVNLHKNLKKVSKLPFRLTDMDFGYHSRQCLAGDSLLYITSQGSGFFRLYLNHETGDVRFDPMRYFPSHYCTDILLDKSGNLWVATSKGLFRQDIRRTYVVSGAAPSDIKEAFPYLSITGMLTVGNELYVGTRGNAGVLVFDKNDLRFLKHLPMGRYADTAASIYNLIQAGKDTLIMGTNGPMLSLDLRSGKLRFVPVENWQVGKDWASGSYKDSKGTIWLAASKMYQYDYATGSCYVSPQAQQFYERNHTPSLFCEDASGNLWIAGNGIGRYNPRTNRFDALPDSLPAIRMPDRQVLALAADMADHIWISSYNNGLVRYHPGTQSYLHFTRDNGLPDNNIMALKIVGDKLWMASYSGIACLDLKTLSIIRYGKEDGFPDLPVVQGTAFYYDSSLHRLYIGFSNEIVSFNPDSLLKTSPEPDFFIENLVVGKQGRYFLPRAPLITNWRNNELTITLGSINYSNSSSQRFAYRIIHEDTSEWHALGTASQFSLSNLPPGHYIIQVKMFSSDNRWPDQVETIDIRIRRQFWKRSWFIAIWAALLLVAGYLFLRWRIRVARAKEQEKTRVQKLIAEDYKNQFELEQINNYFSSSLAGKKDVQEVLWDVAHNLISRLNYKDCMIYLWNEDKTKMVQKAAFGPKGSPEAITRQVFDVLPGQGVVGYVMQTREPLLIPDTRKDSRYRVDEMVRLSEICVPIIHNDELIGIIDSEHPELNYYKARDLKILTTIATLLGNKIKQIESEQSLEKKQVELAIINQQLAEAQITALQAQMNPHFIFNALNSIKRMILDNQQQEASRYLSKFAHMIRLTLNQSKVVFASLQENLEYLESYLDMEKLRFGDSFTWSVAVDEALDEEEVMIPTLMIQPLVENAIWHGLMHKEGEKKLHIGFSKEHSTITCTIEDNGIGIKKSEQTKQQHNGAHKSVGLENLRNRIKILNEKYKTNCRLQITDCSDLQPGRSGTLAVLSFDNLHSKF